MPNEKKPFKTVSLDNLKETVHRAREKNPELFNKYEAMAQKKENDITAILQQFQNTSEEGIRLLEKANSHWGGEDSIYRFYHQSYKVYKLQFLTDEIVSYLVSLYPGFTIEQAHPYFLEIYQQGTGKVFSQESNRAWLFETRPIVEAFLHSKHFLEMLIAYGDSNPDAEPSLSSGFATVLYFYQLR